MPSSNYWSEILLVSSRLLQLINLLTSRYESLPAVILKEHAAIAANDLVELQQTCEEKSELGDFVAQSFADFRTEVDTLFSLAASRIEVSTLEPKGYSEVVALFDTLAENSSLVGVGVDEILKWRGMLADSFGVFRSSFEVVQPVIENNRTVVRTMLEHQQQSFRFWSEIVQEESSSYDASGSRKAKGGASLINIQA